MTDVLIIILYSVQTDLLKHDLESPLWSHHGGSRDDLGMKHTKCPVLHTSLNHYQRSPPTDQLTVNNK